MPTPYTLLRCIVTALTRLYNDQTRRSVTCVSLLSMRSHSIDVVFVSDRFVADRTTLHSTKAYVFLSINIYLTHVTIRDQINILRRSVMARVLKGSHSFTYTPRVHPLTE